MKGKHGKEEGMVLLIHFQGTISNFMFGKVYFLPQTFNLQFNSAMHKIPQIKEEKHECKSLKFTHLNSALSKSR